MVTTQSMLGGKLSHTDKHRHIHTQHPTFLFRIFILSLNILLSLCCHLTVSLTNPLTVAHLPGFQMLLTAN